MYVKNSFSLLIALYCIMLNTFFFNADILDVIECIINETCNHETLKILTFLKSFITKMLYYYVAIYFKFKIHLFINFCLKCNIQNVLFF